MIKILSIEPNDNPHYIKPQKIVYEIDGVVKDWEVVDTHDSVAILLYHKDRDSFVLVKQFRPAVYLKNGDGFTVELCAGLIDKDKSLAEIAKEEISEECGYDVPLNSIERVISFHTAVGFAGGKQTLYFAAIDDGMKFSDGGGLEDEDIEVIYLPICEAKSFLNDEKIVKTPGLMYAFSWFFQAKRNYLNNKILT